MNINKNKKYSCILFDLDGTLTDPFEGITKAVAHALSRFGIECADRNTLKYFIGPPLRESFANYPGVPKDRVEDAVSYYREYFSEKGLFENRVYDGAEDMLRILYEKDVRIILATSKPEVYAKRITEHFGLSKYFYAECGADLEGRYDTKGKVIARALSVCGVPHSEVLMVGDREHDIIGAKENGIDSAGVLWGYCSGDELQSAGADHIFDSMDAFCEAVLRMS